MQALSNLFLSVNSKNEEASLCLLCNKSILENEKESAPTLQGWKSLIEKAKEWSIVDIPPDDNYYGFRFVYSKVKEKDTPNGKRHDMCRIIFGSKIAKYIRKYNVVDLPKTEMIIDGPSFENMNNEGTRVTRSRSGHLKSFDRRCVICQIIRSTESNPFNQGGLGRCQKRSSADHMI